MKFDGKAVAFRFTNVIEHRLMLAGVWYSDLYCLPRDLKTRKRFCKAWAIVLGVELSGSLIKFCNERLDVDLKQVRAEVFKTYERDCRLVEELLQNTGSATKEEKKTERELRIQYLKWREYVCQNCNITRAEFDDLTPLETQLIQNEYERRQSIRSQELRVLDEHFARLELAQFGGKRSRVSDYRLLKDPPRKPIKKTKAMLANEKLNLERKILAKKYLEERRRKYGR